MDPRFIIRCLSEECTVLHAGPRQIIAGELDDEIAKGGNNPNSFGHKLKVARDEVAAL